MGFDHVAAGPLVRSSYHADEHVAQDRPGVGPLAVSVAVTARRVITALAFIAVGDADLPDPLRPLHGRAGRPGLHLARVRRHPRHRDLRGAERAARRAAVRRGGCSPPWPWRAAAGAARPPPAPPPQPTAPRAGRGARPRHGADPARRPPRRPARHVDPGFRKPPAAGLLFDVDTGQVLWRRHPTARRPIASLTKMMTALVVDKQRAAGHAHARHQAGAGHDGLGGRPVQAGQGDRRRDAAATGCCCRRATTPRACSPRAPAGSIRRFVRLMNATRRGSGCAARASRTPSGLEDARQPLVRRRPRGDRARRPAPAAAGA